MEHRNPLLHGESDSKFITIGEIMLRLTPPNYEKIRMTTSFEASYGAVRPILPWPWPSTRLRRHRWSENRGDGGEAEHRGHPG